MAWKGNWIIHFSMSLQEIIAHLTRQINDSPKSRILSIFLSRAKNRYQQQTWNSIKKAKLQKGKYDCTIRQHPQDLCNERRKKKIHDDQSYLGFARFSFKFSGKKKQQILASLAVGFAISLFLKNFHEFVVFLWLKNASVAT